MLEGQNPIGKNETIFDILDMIACLVYMRTKLHEKEQKDRLSEVIDELFKRFYAIKEKDGLYRMINETFFVKYMARQMKKYYY